MSSRNYSRASRWEPSAWSPSGPAKAPEALATLTYNLTVLFQRHLGWQTKVTIHSLRYWLFITAGIISHPRGKTTVRLAVPMRERDWWQRLWDKILSLIPNCNAVENRPAQAQSPEINFLLHGYGQSLSENCEGRCFRAKSWMASGADHRPRRGRMPFMGLRPRSNEANAALCSSGRSFGCGRPR